MDSKRIYLALDVGAKRIGIAVADSIGRIAAPVTTLAVDGSEIDHLKHLIAQHGITDIVVGRPRNQAGELTNQTKEVEQFVQKALGHAGLPIYWQDESVTSILAEERLKLRKKIITKADIDAEAAAIILQDYLEQ